MKIKLFENFDKLYHQIEVDEYMKSLLVMII